MKTVKCKTCDSIIHKEYDPLEGKPKKVITSLQQLPSDDVNTSIYLTCVNGHIGNYFCKLESIELWKN